MSLPFPSLFDRAKKIPVDWPSEDKLLERLDAISGLFVLASTCLNYIGDPEEADPQSQLDSLLTYMSRSQNIVFGNPFSVARPPLFADPREFTA
ncbi:hypothetical protein Agabi119p4_9866 [Agaricus bisporus var. burnettii]|uniref:Uncharacterized protein n=1 Tax=Agaricus bisporus var. burnettii TaxID=192524 RepID=A0A8H7EX77_AGABI|nr:hypothetical protein Agabi119p4_9866 [Agaricus bisporus var. burnettii]